MGIAIGLDFGTTNSVVTYVDDKGALKTFRQNGSPLIPSVIYFKSKDDYIIGLAALALSEKNIGGKISSFKTKLNDLNHKFDEITFEDGTKYKLNAKVAVKLFLNRLIGQVQEYLIKKFGAAAGIINRAVITVPTKFTDAANRAIKNAAASAMNLKPEQIKLVFEPTAAAVAAQNENIFRDTKFLIYDFGGGTFDVSLIQKKNGAFNQINTDGDPNCGGDLLTEILAQYLLDLANKEFGTSQPWDEMDFDEDFHGVEEIQYRKNRNAILREAARIKTGLSDENSITANFQFYTAKDKNGEFVKEILREDLEKLIGEKINHTAEITKRVINSDAAKNIGGVKKIILAGGSSQIPMIRDALKKKIGAVEIVGSENISTLISRGAAILAENISSVENVTSNITPVQLGVASTDGLQYNLFQTIIPADTKLPCEASCDFKLLEDNQRHLEIAYYERDVKNYPLARRIDDDGVRQVDILKIDLPAGLKKSAAVVKINFSVHEDLSLDFSAKVLQNGNSIGEGALQISKASDLF